MKLGIYESMSWEKYRPLQRMNPSTLKAGRVSMKHLRYAETAQDKDTRAKSLGRATHTAILERDRFDETVAVWEGHKRGKAWSEFKAENEGLDILTEPEYENLVGMAEAVSNEPLALDALRGCSPEVTLICEEHGVPCKGRMDAWRVGHIADLKTAARIDPYRFGREAERMGYHISLGLYRRWARSLTGKDHSVSIIAVESSPPYDVMVIPMDEAVLDSGEARGVALIQAYRHCKKTNVWPGVSGGELVPLHWPEWAMDEEVAFAG